MREKSKTDQRLSSQIHRVFLLTFLLGCIVSLILFIPSEISKFKAFVDRIDELIITLIDSKKGRIAFDIYMKNEEALTKQLEDFLNFDDVQTVDVFDPEGNLIKSTDPKEAYKLDFENNTSEESESTVKFNFSRGANLEYTAKLTVAGDTTGYLKIYYSMEKIVRQTIISAVLIVGFILIVFFLYMLLIDKLLKRVVTTPLEQLEKGMQEIEKGNLGAQVNVNSGNEINAITDTFNKMSIENKDLYESLNNMNKTLEKKVAQRTEELNQKNTSLEKAKAEAEKLAVQAKKANKAKSEFLANMSHEIRTPLNGVIGFSELLSGTSLNELQYKYVDNIEKSADVLLSIISDILDFSKIEAGKLDLEFIKTDLKKLIRETLDILNYQAQKKGLELQVNLESTIPHFAIFDPVRMKQVLVNLIGNAIKFTEKGSVKVIVHFSTVDKLTGSFNFQVKDTGIGISEEQKKRLFKAFSQADTSITRKYGGTGLGLVISNMLLKKMGSSLNVKSEPGKGSTFYFTIDTEYSYEKRDVKEPEPEKEALQVITGNPKILIAEDVSINRELIKNLLEQMIPQVQLSMAKDGEDVLEKATNDTYDLILMDIQMPKMSGLEATRKIREKERQTAQHVPVIALSAEVMKETIEKGMDAGMDDFLTKPIKYKALNEVMIKYLSANKRETIEKNKEQEHNLSAVLYGVNFQDGIDRLLGNREAYLAMLEGFIEETQSDIHEIEKAIETDDTETMKNLAHKIKGTAGNLAVFIVEEKTARLEEAVRNDDKTSYIERFLQLKSEIEKFTQSFKKSQKSML